MGLTCEQQRFGTAHDEVKGLISQMWPPPMKASRGSQKMNRCLMPDAAFSRACFFSRRPGLGCSPADFMTREWINFCLCKKCFMIKNTGQDKALTLRLTTLLSNAKLQNSDTPSLQLPEERLELLITDSRSREILDPCIWKVLVLRLASPLCNVHGPCQLKPQSLVLCGFLYIS